MDFLLPPRLEDENGQTRTVGFELEFGGVDLEETATVLQNLFGGVIERQSPYYYQVRTSLGAFTAEADSSFLKEKKFEDYFRALGLDPEHSSLAHGVEDAVAALAGTLIPFEVATPPLPLTRLHVIEEVRSALHEHAAQGTNASIFMAFGMQFNPRVPDRSAATLLAYLRAFFLLYDWVYVESEIPLQRKLAPFIHSFPSAYVEKVLHPAYDPNLESLICDYLEHNPTRNRPLDMLPLFADLDPRRVFSYPVEKDLVKPRPTFHYRLPNSQIDDPNWTVASDWNKWIEIERLAADPGRIAEMSRDYHQVHDNGLFFVRDAWVEKTRGWLHNEAH